MTTNTPLTDDEVRGLRVLVAFAEGRITHAYTGRCPDKIEGPKSRAKGCPVCDALCVLAAIDTARAAGKE